MSEEFLILSYNDTKKKIEIPKTFEELETIFLREFNESDILTFVFQYKDEDGDEVILDSGGYDKAIEDIKKQEERLIIIKREGEKDDKNDEEVRRKESENEEEEDNRSETFEQSQVENEDNNKEFVLDPLKSGQNFSNMCKKN
jgi:hypothetical protein